MDRKRRGPRRMPASRGRGAIGTGFAECDFRQDPERQAAIRQGRTKGSWGRPLVRESVRVRPGLEREPLRAVAGALGLADGERGRKGRAARTAAAGPAKELGQVLPCRLSSLICPPPSCCLPA